MWFKWSGIVPINRKLERSIPDQGTCLGRELGAWVAGGGGGGARSRILQEAMDPWCSPAFSPLFPLSRINIRKHFFKINE